jgi:hypothetical protein
MVRRRSLGVRKRTSGLAGEFQRPGGFQALGVESADFGAAADVQRQHDPVAGYPRGEDFGAFRQSRGRRRRHSASIRAEKAVADHNEQRADAQGGGQARDQHHAADARDHGGLFKGRFGRAIGGGLGHANTRL